MGLTYAKDATAIADQGALAASDGFEHLDVMVSEDPVSLPVGCPTSYPKPIPGWCTTPSPTAGPESWDRVVRWFRAAPGALLEPWAGSVINSIESMRAIQAEVPGLRFLVDTGHVADWGGDPVELMQFADHVQLRQGAPGRTQLHVDDPAGVVDFAAVLDQLDELGYSGKLSIEYFDLPDRGWTLEDPRAWANDLATHLRALG
jgi:sugar phosphate isomerase/epimerase